MRITNRCIKAYVFQRDNARCHVARVCQDFLNQNYISVLPWPALLPDLSPIEQLWHEVVIRVRPRQNPPETLPNDTRV
jgi:hypothetical protein